MNEEHSQILASIAECINPHVPKEICTTEDAVRWLVKQHAASREALRGLEEIRTERLAAKGLGVEASVVSRARVALQLGDDSWTSDDSRIGFPMECVYLLSKGDCNCQNTGSDVDRNRHVESCFVGRAQGYLGKSVEIKSCYENR